MEAQETFAEFMDRGMNLLDSRLICSVQTWDKVSSDTSV